MSLQFDHASAFSVESTVTSDRRQTVTASGLLSQARTGVAWNGATRAVQLLLQFGLSLLLARLLVPADFGLFAVVTSIIGVCNSASSELFLGHLFLVRDKLEEHLQLHFTACVAVQAGVFLLIMLLALCIISLPDHHEIAKYLILMSPIVLFSGIGGFRYRMLELALDWRRLRLLQVAGMLFGTCAVLFLAFSGAGVVALLASQHFKYLPAIVDLLCFERWRPTWYFSWNEFRPAWQFGLSRIGSDTALKSRAMLEATGLAELASVQMLGQLNRATTLTQLVSTNLSTLAGQSLYPVLAKLEPGTDRFREASWLLMHAVCWTIIPAAFLLVLTRHAVVHTLLGPQWSGAIAFLPWVAMSSTAVAIAQIASMLLLAHNQTSHCLAYDCSRLVTSGLSLLLLWFHRSYDYYFFSVVLTEVSLLLLLLHWGVRHKAATTPLLLSAILPPIAASSLAAWISLHLVVLDDRHLFSLPTISRSLTFYVLYILSIRILFATSLARLLSVLPLQRQLFRLMCLPIPR